MNGMVQEVVLRESVVCKYKLKLKQARQILQHYRQRTSHSCQHRSPDRSEVEHLELDSRHDRFINASQWLEDTAHACAPRLRMARYCTESLEMAWLIRFERCVDIRHWERICFGSSWWYLIELALHPALVLLSRSSVLQTTLECIASSYLTMLLSMLMLTLMLVHFLAVTTLECTGVGARVRCTRTATHSPTTTTVVGVAALR